MTVNLPYCSGFCQVTSRGMLRHTFVPKLRALPWTLAAVTLIACSGCGGGGGGITSAVLTYTTDWTTRSDPASGSGQSQLVALYDANGSQVAKKLINRNDGSSLEFSDVSAGNYELVAELYSGTDTSGTKLGTIERVISLSDSTTFTSAVGSAPTAVAVTGWTSSLQVDQTTSLYAAAVDAAGRNVFVEAGAFDWASLGGVASVTTAGIVQGTVAGTGSIRATHRASGALGSFPLTVSEHSTSRSKWTVLVYLNAANDLYTYSTTNVDQMERVGDNTNCRFIVQWKQSRNIFPNSSFDGTRRYLVSSNTTDGVQSELIQNMGTSVDMGVPETLADFIAWGKRNYPADRYALVIWNHGSGWSRKGGPDSRSVSYDDETGNVIYTWQLRQALANQHLDIIAFDASLMQMIEVAYEIRDHADFVAGSEESPPGEGYPYDAVFQGFRNTPDGTTKDLSKGFVTGMINNPDYVNRKITQSVLETAKLPAVATAVDGLADQLIQNRATVTSVWQNARGNAQSYSPSATRYYRDLIHLCTFIGADTTAAAGVRSAANQVVSATGSAIVWNAANENSKNSTGLSIDTTPGTRFAGLQADYRLMQFGADTRWDDWLLQSP